MAHRFSGTIGIGALLLTCGMAHAAEWVSLGESANRREEVFVDVSSIRVAGNVRRAWTKILVAPHTQTLEHKWVSFFLILKAFDCVEKTSRYEATTTYYDDRTNHPAPAASFPMPWEPVPPDTNDSSEMEFLCAWKPSAAAYASKYASKWVSLGKTNDGKTETFLDVSSVKGAGTIWRVWQKNVPVPHTVRGVGPDPTKWVHHYLSLIAFNCTQGLYRFEAVITHYEDGSEFADPPETFPQPWESVSPDSLASAKLDIICTAKVK